jgi:heme-degrading monooxygenase HmoA
MFALFFDVLPHPGHDGHYFDRAASLKAELDRNGGVAMLERFRSLDRPGWILSHQIWADMASMDRWRGNGDHRRAMHDGRQEHFADYRIRVASVIGEIEFHEGLAVVHSTTLAPNEAIDGRLVFVAIRGGQAFDAANAERFESVYRPGQFATIAVVGDAATGDALLRSAAEAGCESARLCLVSRDYSLTDRKEAPPNLA